MPPIVIIILILAFAALGVYLWREDQKRQKALRIWALRRHFQLDREKRKGWQDEYPGLKVFQRGHSKSGKNIITGTFHDRPVTLLDYRYTTGHGKNRSNHRRAVVILHCDFPTIPLQIRRENPFDRVGEFLGMDDIDFESVEFSRKFYVTAPDRKWAYDIIHARTMEYLLGAPHYNVEFGMGEIAILRNRWSDPQQYDAALEMAWQLYQLIPEFVIQQMKGGRT